MKDFDQDRASTRATEEDRTFVLGGETFVSLPEVHPDVLAAYDRITPESNTSETMEIVDDVIVQLIDPRDKSEERYRAVRANRQDPISLAVILEVVKWLLEVQTGRPTGPPSDSGSGQTSTETSSTVASSSPEAEAA